MLGALSDGKSGLQFSVFAGHRQCSLSQAWVERDYFFWVDFATDGQSGSSLYRTPWPDFKFSSVWQTHFRKSETTRNHSHQNVWDNRMQVKIIHKQQTSNI
jgi:hypothetical protein